MSVGSFPANPAFPQLKIATDPGLMKQTFRSHLRPVGGKVYDTVIPRSVRLSEAPSHGKPGVAYDKIGKGSRAYMKLADEFLKQERRK